MKKINALLVFTAMVMIVLGFSFRKSEAETIQSGNVVGLEVGNLAPEISLKNPNDSLIPLSSLKGKVVLIDFWASWCGPCRMENPNVVSVYNRYKSAKFKGNAKGFTVYNVSLDKSRDHWKNAIIKDKLSWPYHVSDLKYWQSEAAAAYGISSIPYNLLIDGRGVIVAKNLRGPNLETAVKKLLASQ